MLRKNFRESQILSRLITIAHVIVSKCSPFAPAGMPPWACLETKFFPLIVMTRREDYPEMRDGAYNLAT